MGPPLFQRLRAQQAIVSKIWKKYIYLRECIGYIFAKIMFLIKYNFIGVLLNFLSPNQKVGVFLSTLRCGCLVLRPTMFLTIAARGAVICPSREASAEVKILNKTWMLKLYKKPSALPFQIVILTKPKV